MRRQLLLLFFTYGSLATFAKTTFRGAHLRTILTRSIHAGVERNLSLTTWSIRL